MENQYENKTTEEISSILKGQPNTEVSILIERNEKSFVKKFNREKNNSEHIPYFGVLESGVGYIKLRSFTRNCVNEVKNVLVKFKITTRFKRNHLRSKVEPRRTFK